MKEEREWEFLARKNVWYKEGNNAGKRRENDCVGERG